MKTLRRRSRSFPAAFAALALAGAAFSQDARVGIGVAVGAGDGNCALSISRPALLSRWRAYKDGALLTQKKGPDGPWGPQRVFTCSLLELSEDTIAQADYIIFEHDQGPPACMGACP